MKGSFFSTDVDSLINEFKPNFSVFCCFFFKEALILQTGLFICLFVYFMYFLILQCGCPLSPQAIALPSVRDGPWVYNYGMYRTEGFSHCPMNTLNPLVVSPVRRSPSCRRSHGFHEVHALCIIKNLVARESWIWSKINILVFK